MQPLTKTAKSFPGPPTAWRVPALVLVMLAMVAIDCASRPRRSPSELVELRGVIRDRDGAGVEGVMVFVDRADDPPTPGGTTGGAVTTNHRGAYRMGLRPGPYHIILFGRGIRVPDGFLDTIWVTAPITKFDYQYGGAKIRGRVTGPGGHAVRSGVIVAYGTDSRSRRGVGVKSRIRKGRYLFFVPPGKYYFESDSLPPGLPTFRSREIHVSTDTIIDFSAEGHRMVGRVLLGAEMPLAGARVRGWGESYGIHTMVETVTRLDGSYEIYLPSGRYSLFVQPASSQAFIAPRLFERPVAESTISDLDMSGIEWTGTVRDSLTGAAIDSITVGLQCGSLWAEAVSHSGGQFRLVVRPGLVYSIALTKPGGLAPVKQLTGIRAVSDSSFDLIFRAAE